MTPSKFTVIRHLMDQLASELALGSDLRERLRTMPAGRHRGVLEHHLAETLGHAERVRNRVLQLGESGERSGLGTRLAGAVAGRTRSLASASVTRLAGSGDNARVLDDAMDDCAAVAREIAAYVALARLAGLADDDRTASLAAALIADEERMLQRLLAEVSDLAEALTPEAPEPTVAPRAAKAERRQRTPRPARRAGPSSYDGLSANQVIARLGELSQVDLARLAEHERRNHNRAAVVRRIAALQGAEPWRGYDGLNVGDVRSALDGASRELLDSVHAYEREHKNRDTILKVAAR